MPLVNLSMKHGTTLAEAEEQLSQTVAEVTSKFGGFVREVEWGEDRRKVKLTGPGVWVTMRVDAEHVHAEGDIPALTGLLGGGVKKALEGAIRRKFPKALPEK
ncbi:polyhydroxyalkanoic acid system family protein [Alienimonas sp. DA493]|uniref:polyhydroxyalkanoic acid system family protein n=1 Tax=Alienimonas sp. DA493 TaxID=3373605 RepID=UPI003753ED89